MYVTYSVGYVVPQPTLRVCIRVLDVRLAALRIIDMKLILYRLLLARLVTVFVKLLVKVLFVQYI